MSEPGSQDTIASEHSGASEDSGPAWVGWLQIGGIAIVIVIAALLTMWLGSLGGGEPGTPPERPPAPVRVIQPEIISHRIEVSLTGTIDATALVPLAPQVSGRIIEVSPSVRAGAAFEAGEVLFRIDPRDYQVAVSRAQAALADARAAAQQEEAQAQIAINEWESLYPNRPITPLAAREPQLAAARARLLAAQADLAQAELNLERTEISLPFDGRVTDSRVEAGLLALSGQSLGNAFDLETLEVIAPIAPADLARLGNAEGLPVTIDIEGAAQALTSEVARIGSRLDGRTRFIDLFIPVGGLDAVLQPGLFANLTIEGPQLSEVMILPASAMPGLESVNVIDDGVVGQRTVTVLDRSRDSVIVERFDPADGVIVSALPENAIGRAAEIVESRP